MVGNEVGLLFQSISNHILFGILLELEKLWEVE